MIDLEIPRKFRPLLTQARGMAEEVFWPISRKYDLAEHTYPAELDVMAALIDGLGRSGSARGAGATGSAQAETPNPSATPGVRNGANPSSVLSPPLIHTRGRRPAI